MGRKTQQLWASPSHCRDPGKQCPVTMAHSGPPSLAGHDSLPRHHRPHQLPFLFPDWGLMLFCPHLGTAHQPWGFALFL